MAQPGDRKPSRCDPAGARDHVPYALAEALIGQAAAEQGVGQLAHAYSLAHEALAIVRQAGHRLLEGQALTALAAIRLDLGQPDEAAWHAEQALLVHGRTGHRLGEARTHLVLGNALCRTDRKDATKHWHQALALLSAIGTPPEADQVRALQVEAKVLTSRSDA